MTPDVLRWLTALVLGALGGIIAAVTDSATFPGWYDLIRHGLIGMGPVAVSLKMTLDRKP